MQHLPMILMLAAACVLGAGCGTDSEPTASKEAEAVIQPEFEGVLWRLVELRDETGEMVSVLDETTVDATFDDGALSGTAGCNRYFGSYSLGPANHLTLGSEMGSTQMACIPEVMAQEQAYLALLGQVAVVTRMEDELRLEDANSSTVLKFLATHPATLESTEWQASGINNGRGGVVSSATTPLSSALFSEGRLSGVGGCNQFTATYEIDSDQLSIGPVAATRMHCNEPEGIMDQEQQYFAALERVRRFTLTPETLELRDEDGALQVSFRTAVNQGQSKELLQ